jgi:hypothetical protein
LLFNGFRAGSAIIFQVRAFSQKTKFENNFKLKLFLRLI